MPGDRHLTAKQRRFVEAYAGNGTEAARIAGYSGNDNVLAQAAFQLLRNPKIRSAIEGRQAKANGPIIATRQERQAFWSSVMKDENAGMMERLRASELLGKSEADFTDKLKVDAEESLLELVTKSYDKSGK